MPDPKGKIIVICGFRDDGTLHAVELSDADSLKVYVEGGEVTVSAHALLDGTVNNDTIANAPTRGSVIVGNATPKWTELVLGAVNKVLASDGTDLVYKTLAELATLGFYSGYIHIRDEKTQNTHGGTFTSGAWQTRDLNVEVEDTGGDAVLASNQITLAAGTYRVLAICPTYKVGSHQARLYDITGSAVLVLGNSAFANVANDAATFSTVAGRFTITVETVIELQHQCQNTNATAGFGVAAEFATEIYSVIELWKEV